MSLSRNLRSLARRLVDSAQYSPRADAVAVGDRCAWVMDCGVISNHTPPVMFSCGVGNDVSFELEFLRRFGGNAVFYDPSETGGQTMAKIPEIRGLHYSQKALSATDAGVQMCPPISPAEGSWTIHQTDQAVATFESVSLVAEIHSKGFDWVDIIKLDIEGFEYQVLDSLLESDIKIGQILVEFHEFLPEIKSDETKKLRRLLQKHGFHCFYKRRYDHSCIHLDAVRRQNP